MPGPGVRDAAPEGDVASIQPERLAYEPPRLRVYGTVQDLTRGRAGSGTDGSMMQRRRSERSLKENVVRIGTHALGFGLYLFDYKPEFRATCGHGRQFGVMADEVERVLPDAVSVHADGNKRVDYARLGIKQGKGR